MDNRQKKFFEEIYDTYYSKVYNYVFYRVLNAPLADDLTGEIFVKLIKSYRLFNPSISVSAWIFTIARNLVTDHFKANARAPLAAPDSSFCDIPDEAATKTDARLAKNEEFRQLHTALSTLNERERSTLSLRFWGRMTYAEIAKYLGLSEKNISVTISRAIKKLKKKCSIFA